VKNSRYCPFSQLQLQDHEVQEQRNNVTTSCYVLYGNSAVNSVSFLVVGGAVAVAVGAAIVVDSEKIYKMKQTFT
jgi:hypothetical protein